MAETLLGPKLEAGWRVGTGDIPPYDGGIATAERGEFPVGVAVPLLEGLGMSEARAGLLDGRLGVGSAQAARSAKRIAIRQKAEQAWWKWVAAGAKRDVARQQVELADRRNRALTVEVREGARARIELLDNERVLFERQGALARAEQELAVSALILSLWYRDDGGRPIVPAADDLPELDTLPLIARDVQTDLTAAQDRPDLQGLRVQRDRGQLALTRGRNEVLPSFDAKVQARQDVTDEPTELVVGAALEFPLLRKGRGTRDQAAAVLSQTEQRLQAAEDQVSADVLAAHQARDAAQAWATASTQSVDRADAVLELQRQSWELGASDLFVLLLREEKLAKARQDAIDARLALADVALRATVGATP